MDISLHISWVNEIMDFPGGSDGKQSFYNDCPNILFSKF